MDGNIDMKSGWMDGNNDIKSRWMGCKQKSGQDNKYKQYIPPNPQWTF